ncbi:MAG: TonB-dependent receptor [Muribaculaceae bacterium]|nr:TonB-dependent receptor [Muribaculaceae bacterium]
MNSSSNRRKMTALMAVALLGGGALGVPTFTAMAEQAPAVAPIATVTGTVTDASGEPLIGATVLVKGSTNGTSTDIDGNFTLKNVEGKTIVVSYVGYKTKEVAIAPKMEIVLDEDAANLDELVVVGYGVQKKGSITGAVSAVDDKAFADKAPASNPLADLQGQIPGMMVTRGSTAPGREGWDFKVRGEASVNNTSALVIVDGVPGGIADLNPDDIENISVLKDASAAIYGARAAGGVVLVTTKRGSKIGKKPTVSYSGNVTWKVSDPQVQWMNLQQWATCIEEVLYNEGISSGTLSTFTNVGSFPYAAIMAMKRRDPQYMGTVQSYAALGGNADAISDIGFIDSDQYSDTFGNAFAQSHSLGVSGGNDVVRYNVSLGYMYDGSPLQFGIKENGRRYTARANNDFKIAKWFDLATTIAFARRDNTYPLNNPSGVNGNPPGSPIFSSDGQHAFGWLNNYSDVAVAKFGGGKRNIYNETVVNIRPTFHIIKGLDLSGTVGYTIKDWVNKETQYKNYMYNWDNEKIETMMRPTDNRFTRFNRSALYQIYQGYLNYLTDFGTDGNHNLSAMVGASYEREDSESTQSKLLNLADGFLESLSSSYDPATSKVEFSDDKWTTAIASYFGRINYDYQGRYLIELLGRYDGSSKFVRGKKWKGFYGVSGGWRISDEKFMHNITWLNDLKIRASYGETGNQEGIGTYDFVGNIKTSVNGSNTTGAGLFGPTGSAGPLQTLWQDNVISLDRTWEVVKNTNIGIDFAVLSGRLSGSLEYFWKTNDNMLVGVTYPSVFGAGAPKTNSGTLKVNGWEIQLNWRDRIGDVTYNVGFNISDAKNKLVSMPNSSNFTQNGITKYREGYALNSMFGFDFVKLIENQEELESYRAMLDAADGQALGLDTSILGIGDAMYADLDGDGNIDYDDVKLLGNTTPRYSYSLNLGGQWKGFDLNVIFQGVGKASIIRDVTALTAPGRNIYQIQGGQWYDKTWGYNLGEDPRMVGQEIPYYNMGADGSLVPTTITTQASDYRTPNNDPYNSAPRWHRSLAAYNYLYSDAWYRLQNMAYCRLKNLTVGYTLPVLWTSKIGIEKVRLYFTGTDLFTIRVNKDKTDPENMATNPLGGTSGANAYPFYRSYTIGLNLTF